MSSPPFSESTGQPLLTCSSALKKLSCYDLQSLVTATRAELIAHHQQFGGHFASSLGVVELTVALHHVYDTPEDKLVWDTGHQTYGHKILTGRRDRLYTIRRSQGLKPFPCPSESIYDSFLVGHAGTAISAATGMAWANQCKKNGRHVVAIVGDGALNCGLSFEALNHAGSLALDLTIIINHNGYSISPCTGALAKHLAASRNAKKGLQHQALPETPSAFLGFQVWDWIDGHHLPSMIQTLSRIKCARGKHIVLLATQKGKGDPLAQADPVRFHATTRTSTRPPCAEGAAQLGGPSGSETFGRWAMETARADKRIQIISPAMLLGSGLEAFSKAFPNHCLDVGIAESHAVTLAAGMAISGLKPIVAIYSTFLQRSYDQVVHDVAIRSLPVIFAIDRAGLVGEDGETHQGLFDLPMLNPIPNLCIFAPSQASVLYHALQWSYQTANGPVMIRYPKRALAELKALQTLELSPNDPDLPELLRPAIYQRGCDRRCIFINFGALLESCLVAATRLKTTLIDVPCVKPFPWETLKPLLIQYDFWITVEESLVHGGIGQRLSAVASSLASPASVLNLGVPERFIPCATVDQQLAESQLDPDGICARVYAWQAQLQNTQQLISKKRPTHRHPH